MNMMILVACGLAVLVLVGLMVGLVLLLNTGPRDAVSTARQGWMDSRTGKDTSDDENFSGSPDRDQWK